MQLTRLMRRSGKAVWLLVLVPILAVAASTAVTMRSEPSVRSLATVSVIAPDGTSTAATVTQAVDGFKSTVVSDGVVQQAADESGVGLSASDVRAERIGTSNLVEVRVTTQPGEDGNAAMTALVEAANNALFASTIATAEARVTTAEQRYENALAEREKETAETGLLLPMEAYRAKAAEVTQLRVALATADSSVDGEAVRAALKQAIADLARIGTSVNSYESLAESVTRTRTELGAAQQAVEDGHARLAAAGAQQSITIADPTTQSTRTTVVRGAVTALVLGLALALGLVLLIGLLRKPDRSVGPHERHRDDPSRDDRTDEPGSRKREAALT
ncbi:hypothetical protein [Nocardioides sp. SR21]|uniref:hypothetical protein n=1 Tax=Nocardioides sp. SR21 TaxID=2919501 RepID=UPI001FAAE2EB|nr:hypothetical protein [Nocardioides sp. SR21]